MTRAIVAGLGVLALALPICAGGALAQSTQVIFMGFGGTHVAGKAMGLERR